MTPNLAVIHFTNPYWARHRLWLPLFLLWVPALLFAPIVVPLLLIVCLIARVSFLNALGTGWAILSGLRGTEVSWRMQANQIHIRIV